MQQNIGVHLPQQESNPINWLPNYPNPADFRFDYFKLMKNSQQGLAKMNNKTGQTVAIVGAGIAGITAARELLRCGFKVTIYEASDRIGGRLYTAANPNGADQTGMEMGAMRMPFFAEPGQQNCLLEYYLLYEAGLLGHQADYSLFPNPGSAVGGTGIYMNEGLGPNNDFSFPKMIRWPQGEKPEDTTLKNLAIKTERFIHFFTGHIKEIYTEDSNRWPQLWQKIVKHYDAMNFGDLVMAPAMSVYAVDNGDFGGFGMTPHEARLLYTIGTGDGSWGAFYAIGALWFIRCTMFGFCGDKLQTIEGLSFPEQLPYYGDEKLTDSDNKTLAPPTYKGVQSLVEYLFYCKAPGALHSLYDSPNARLFTRTSVSQIVKQADGSIMISHNEDHSELFDYVIVTSAQWASQMSFQLIGFNQEQLPQLKITGKHCQHNISSCKLFFPLTERYWEQEHNKIPQVIVTDTYIQDAYSLAWGTSSTDSGVILASYTWEDDSLKLMAFDQEKLVKLVTDKLQQITMSTVQQDITEYINKDKPVMIQWIKEPTYNGCAKLYHQRNEAVNHIDLSYNQDYGKASQLYFAGENYSVEGGWTEPAMRSAIDAVMQLLHHAEAEFTVDNFDFSRDYPKWNAA